MTLREVTAGCGLTPTAADAGLTLTGITADSREVRQGMLFVALPKRAEAGFRYDGHDFIDQAVDAGAAAIVASDADRVRGLRVPVLLCAEPRAALPRLAARWFGDASRDLRLVGVTGTNGKTTTTYLLEAIFRARGWATVLAGTVETRLAGDVRPAQTTTPDPVSLQRLWREAVSAGCAAGAMEVSSHALDQHRVEATRFEVAVFCNLTQDHLDYHPDMEAYFQAKALLFGADDDGWRPRAVINVDCPYGRRLLAMGPREPLSFGLDQPAEVRGGDLESDATGSSFTVTTPAGEWRQRIGLPGRFNVANALGAIACGLAMDLEPETLATALAGAAGAPGRLDRVDAGQPFGVFVDYAHTPDALENVLRAARGFTANRLIVVFGCGGDRDRTKRPRMGAIAAALADVAVVTSDNPRTESPRAILDDILAGMAAEAPARVLVEEDRRAAIGLALGEAAAGDVVIIAGKGHEDYQILGVDKIHFDDRRVAREWLEQRG